jgi:proline racemase
MAALQARGELAVGTEYHQESITGSVFTGWLEERAGALVPFIRGSAYVTSRATLHFDPADPFRFGFPEG